jgi:hypothetical protein
VGGLGHFLEDEGVATVQISLIREHTERIQPPRALWVPFPLGRPLGAPNQPDFQLDVLRHTFALLDAPSGPVLRDYPHDAPTAGDVEQWACPVSFAAPAPASEADALIQQLQAEARLLAPWFEEGRRLRGRTAVGNSGKGPEAIDEMLGIFGRFASNGTRDVPDGFAHAIPDAGVPGGGETPNLLRYLGDDIKAYYFEAAASQPGRAFPTPEELNEWFFLQTLAGAVFYRVRERLVETEDQSLPYNHRPSWVIVPAAMSSRRPDGVQA